VSPHILKTLEDRGWIDEIGHKDAPGRPALFATTRHFLDDLNLMSLDELPALHELQATLDMSQAGAVLSGGESPALAGFASAGMLAGAEAADAEAGTADGEVEQSPPIPEPGNDPPGGPAEPNISAPAVAPTGVSS
jgi:segregation and condensation protein B